jgi:hypothetical protein
MRVVRDKSYCLWLLLFWGILVIPLIGNNNLTSDLSSVSPASQKPSINQLIYQNLQNQEDTPTPAQITKVTRTPRPTSTPVPIPPPPEPGNIYLMIFFGVVAVLVILIGVWINREALQETKKDF